MKYLVVGAGLSGLMAAKTAAESGLSAVLLGKGIGAIQVLPGGIDVLGYYPEDAVTAHDDVRLALRRLIQERPDHPYVRVGEQDIDFFGESLLQPPIEGFCLFDKLICFRIGVPFFF